jgi:hypothetical protein
MPVVSARVRKYLLYDTDLMVGTVIEMPVGTPGTYYCKVYEAFEDLVRGRRRKQLWTSMFHMDEKEKVAGVYYEYDLCYHGGMFALLKLPETTDGMVLDAKNILRRDRDVVSLSVVRIKKLIPFTMPEREA